MKIDIDGMARQLQDKISGIIATADRTDLYMDIGELLRSYMMEEQFATLGRYLNGQEWAGLSAGYKKYKAKKDRKPRADLQFTGRLAASFDYRILNGGLVLNNSAPYAEALSKGTKYMPARPIFPLGMQLPDDVVLEIEDLVKVWVIDNINNLK